MRYSVKICPLLLVFLAFFFSPATAMATCDSSPTSFYVCYNSTRPSGSCQEANLRIRARIGNLGSTRSSIGFEVRDNGRTLIDSGGPFFINPSGYVDTNHTVPPRNPDGTWPDYGVRYCGGLTLNTSCVDETDVNPGNNEGSVNQASIGLCQNPTPTPTRLPTPTPTRIPTPTPTHVPTMFEIPVLVMSYFPLADGWLDPNITGLNFTLEEIRTRVNRVTNDTVDALERGSVYHGYRDQVATPSLDYRIAQSYEYLTAIPLSQNQVPWNPGWYRPDYMGILNNINICDYVDNRGVKEVWIWSYHHGGVEPNESNMAMGRFSQVWWNHGSYGDVSNGEQINDMPVCQKTYTLFNYNYGNGLGNALEDHTHQLEEIFGYVDYYLFWNKFVGPCGSQEFYRCGWTHYAPNVREFCSGHAYDWMDERTVLSDCEHWAPEAQGQKTEVNCHTWAGVDCDQHHDGKPNAGGVAFKVWWMQNLPGKDNGLVYQGRLMLNWWDYMGDFDNTVRFAEKSFFYPVGTTPTPAGCPNGDLGNLNCDALGKIDSSDLDILTTSFAPLGPAISPPLGQHSADLNTDGVIDEEDLSILLKNWNQ